MARRALGLRFRARPGKIRPIRGHERARAVTQHEDEQQSAPSMTPPEQRQRLSLQRMTRANDGDLLGITVQVVAMGSVSCCPSRQSTMNICARFSPDES
jgi:hypothetical protein